MKTVGEYLDQAKEITGSDYRTAKLLEVTGSAISNIRKTNTIGLKLAPKLADLIGINPAEIVAASDSVNHPENRQYWEKWVASVAVIAIGIMGFSSLDSVAYENNNDDTLTIMRTCGYLAVVAIAAVFVCRNDSRTRSMEDAKVRRLGRLPRGTNHCMGAC